MVSVGVGHMRFVPPTRVLLPGREEAGTMIHTTESCACLSAVHATAVPHSLVPFSCLSLPLFHFSGVLAISCVLSPFPFSVDQTVRPRPHLLPNRPMHFVRE